MSNRQHLFVFMIRPIVRCFFDRAYLRGRFFDHSHVGWLMGLRCIFWQKIIGKNRHVPWPCSPLVSVGDPKLIEFHPDDMNNFWTFGTYFQVWNDAKIVLGRGSYVGPNVGLITHNHDREDLDKHLPGEDIVIGERCWIGMNSVVLPGCVLGPRTTVGAGSVVTQSFPEGACTLVGVPATPVRPLST